MQIVSVKVNSNMKVVVRCFATVISFIFRVSLSGT